MLSGHGRESGVFQYHPLLPKSTISWVPKTPVTIAMALPVCIIKETQILPKLGIRADSARGMISELEGKEYLKVITLR